MTIGKGSLAIVSSPDNIPSLTQDTTATAQNITSISDHLFLNVPYPAAIHLAIINLAAPLTDNPPDVVFASLTEMKEKVSHYLHNSTTNQIVDCCNPTESNEWDLNTLLDDQHVGFIASCSDLIDLGVLDLSASLYSTNPDFVLEWKIPNKRLTSDYCSSLSVVINDPKQSSYLKHQFKDYLLCRDHQTNEVAKQLHLQAQLGDTTYEEAKLLLQQYYQQIHQYNEIKDMAQSIIGRLALLEDTTINRVYTDLGLDPNED